MLDNKSNHNVYMTINDIKWNFDTRIKHGLCQLYLVKWFYNLSY